MERKKFNYLQLNTILGGYFCLLVILMITINISLFKQRCFADSKSTLSASVDESTVEFSGNDIIESASESASQGIDLIVNTSNKSGYTATISTSTDETALVNTEYPSSKIDSTTSKSPLWWFDPNTWGYSFDYDNDFSPIPGLSNPATLIETHQKTYSDDHRSIRFGMKLNDNLRQGNYVNKLIISIVTNPYETKALVTSGTEFNKKLKSLLEDEATEIKYFRRSLVSPASTANVKNIEDEDSDYEIKLWLDPTTESVYYYSDSEKIYLNEDSSWMFEGNKWWDGRGNLTNIDMSGFNTEKVKNMNYMFYELYKLTTLNLSNFNTSNVTKMRGMFMDLDSITGLDLSNFDTRNVTDMAQMFMGLDDLTSLDLSNFNTQNVTDMHQMFASTFKLATLNLSNFDTRNVENMSDMFRDMRVITSLDLSNFNTQNVKTMNSMFHDAYNLSSLNLTSFNTQKVTDMSEMFHGLINITSLNLSNFDTRNVKNMDAMFWDVRSLTSLDLSNFNTQNVTDMGSMFSSMENLTTLDLSNFNTQNVTDINGMFSNMSKLVTLDISNFDTRNVVNVSSLFKIYEYECGDNLETIYVGADFNTEKMLSWSSGMFENRYKLRGGAGSFLADPSTADKSWLRIDDPTHGRPGYFTRKP
jgi:hypothetical protein